jgi:hypothetical protein
MFERCVFTLLSLALAASLVGFFLYVAILPNLTVTALLAGLFGMFWLGIRVGRRPQEERISDGAGYQGATSEANQLSLL